MTGDAGAGDVEAGDAGKRERLGLYELVAIGIGGMVGGGIFSVLGLAIGEAGHAAPLAFAFGGVLALLTGHSYARLGLAFRSAGGSFSYMEHAFAHRNFASIGGWLLVVGYVGTLALYAYTFGVYGTAMLGSYGKAAWTPHALQSAVLLAFLAINLYGVKAAGMTEVVIVLFKVAILGLFAVAGVVTIREDHALPLLDKGGAGVLVGAALIFVAYEGFELIPNAVHDMKDPERDLPRGIVISIAATIAIYLLVSLVAVGNLTPAEIVKYKEYALAVAAKPFFGEAGFLLIGLAALLSTASAINATLFGTARLGMVMAEEETLPKVFSMRERTRNIPWVSLLLITAVTLVFVNTSDLAVIASFASSVFLMIFALINLSAFRLRRRIGIGWGLPVLGCALSAASWLVLCGYLWRSDGRSLLWIAALYVVVALAELLYSERRVVFRRARRE